MAGQARNLSGLVRRALAGSDLAIGQAGKQARGFAAESKASVDGQYSPGYFSRTKPVDRSHEWVAKNPYIEAWYYRRDNFEKEFVWNYRNTVEAIWMIGGFSFGAYFLSLWCMRQADRRSGLPQRALMMQEGFVLPDEREFY